MQVNNTKSEKVYSCRVFDIYEDEFVLPSGTSAKQSRLVHLPSIAVIPILKEEIILIKQYRHAIRQEILEIPAGNMDRPNESPEASAARELQEEIGYKPGKLLKLFEGYSLPGYCTEYMHYYLALDLTPAKLPGDTDEMIELFPVSWTKVRQMLENKQIIDAKTVLGLHLAAKYLKKDL